MLLARLRWSAFGLRGRIVGAVLVTTAISLGVAALVLLPRLESVLKNASKTTLATAFRGNRAYLDSLGGIKYWLIPEAAIVTKGSAIGNQATRASRQLVFWEKTVKSQLGVSNLALCAPVDAQGNCDPVGGQDPTA